MAQIALRMGCFKESKQRVALVLEQVLNQPRFPGWVVKLQKQATAVLRPAYAELAQRSPDEAVLGIDESPMKDTQGRAWLGRFVAYPKAATPPPAEATPARSSHNSPNQASISASCHAARGMRLIAVVLGCFS